MCRAVLGDPCRAPALLPGWPPEGRNVLMGNFHRVLQNPTFFLYSLPNLSCFPPNLPNFTNFTKIYQSTKNCKFVLRFQPISLIILFRLDGVSKHRKISKRCPEYISSVVEVSSCFYQKNVSCFARN